MRGKVCLRCNTCIFLVAQKMCRKLSWKRYLQIAFCLVSSDSNCIAVSEGGKIQNTKKAYDSMQHIFWAMEIIPIFFQEYRTFSNPRLFEGGDFVSVLDKNCSNWGIKSPLFLPPRFRRPCCRQLWSSGMTTQHGCQNNRMCWNLLSVKFNFLA